jgi:two-component system alkaline phosphatase synthesis response regulator PhoP
VSGEPAPRTSPPRRILLVEDEPSLLLTLTDRLVAEGYRIDAAADGESAVAAALGTSFDLVILDVMLPGKDGFAVCRELRQRGLEIPIVMLTARGQVVDRVVGLRLGADDYLTKPFEMIELLARLEAQFRRSRRAVWPGAAGAVGTYAFGDVRVDFRRGEVFRGEAPVAVSALEFKLLTYFIQHRGELLSRTELLDKVWGYEVTPATRTVDVHVASLRQKLEPNPAKPALIVTAHGRGYRFTG